MNVLIGLAVLFVLVPTVAYVIWFALSQSEKRIAQHDEDNIYRRMEDAAPRLFGGLLGALRTIVAFLSKK